MMSPACNQIILGRGTMLQFQVHLWGIDGEKEKEATLFLGVTPRKPPC